MELLLILFAVGYAEGEMIIKLTGIPIAIFYYSFKPFQIKGYQTKLIQLGPREGSFSNRLSVQLMMSSFCFLRGKIHLSVNISSSGTTDLYLKVISISPILQGKKRLTEIGKGLQRHEF